jgi:hypothetical protein
MAFDPINDCPTNAPTNDAPTLNQLADRFRRFAQQECCDSSPLYDQLSRMVAQDNDLLAIAGCAQAGQPAANLFFAAVQFLLFQNPDDSLARHFPSLSTFATSRDDLSTDFRNFCFSRKDDLKDLLRTKLVQTNEVRRSACLLPVLQMIYEETNGQPLYLIDIGASAGLNLLFDRYHFDYGQDQTFGDSESPVQIYCQSRGRALPLSATFPQVASRVAIDLNPLDVHKQDDVLWLKALIWPEHDERRKLLDAAVLVAKHYPIRHVQGDGVALLPALLNEALPDTRLCIIHSFTINQMAPQAVQNFQNAMRQFSKRRSLYCVAISCKDGASSNLGLSCYQNGAESKNILAKCSDHGTWIEWL